MDLDTDKQARRRNDNESFLAAASAGAIDPIVLLLDGHGVSINTVDRFRQTALFHAIQASCEDCALYLLKRGIDWRAHNKRRMRALHLAAGMGLGAVVDWLIDAGDDVNISRANIDTPLIVAARHGNTDVAGRLLDAGADLNARGKKK